MAERKLGCDEGQCSWRDSAEGPQSNIRWSYGHTTIPRHLRDMVVTEYGVADLRGGFALLCQRTETCDLLGGMHGGALLVLSDGGKGSNVV